MRLDPKTIVRRLKKNNGRVRQTARDLGISPQTVSNWAKRARTGVRQDMHMFGVFRRSTKPKRARRVRISPHDQDRITAQRKRTGYCAAKITYELGLSHHPSTIHRFLKRKGLTDPYGYHRRPRYQETTHMHAKNALMPGKLQMDVKVVTPELSGLIHTCYLYAVMDIFSRYKQGLIFPLLDQAFAMAALRGILSELPLIADFIQTDNGLEFQARFHTLVTEELQLDHHYIHKSSPNENAVIERSFRTDEEEFFFFHLPRMGRPHDLTDLNLKYQAYLQEYNERRPHLSLNLMTPRQKLESVH